MENATKALLIAAAVLVAIIIISITLVIVNQGQETASGADLSEIEAAEFNAPFLMYEGNEVPTDKVNALLNTVFQHNKQELASGENRYVAISVLDEYSTPSQKSIKTVTALSAANVSTLNTVPKLPGTRNHKVVCSYTGARISSIKVTFTHGRYGGY